MTTILERHYPTNIIASILANHLRVSEADDELYKHAVQCVRNAFDVAEEYTNRIICDSLATFSYDDLEDSVIELPSAPIKEVVEVRYLGADNQYHALDASTYSLIGNAHHASLELSALPTLSTMRRKARVEVSVRCGFDDYSEVRTESTSDYPLPGSIEQAIMLLAGSFFEFQGDIVVGSTTEIPLSAKHLLNAFRRYPYGL